MNNKNLDELQKRDLDKCYFCLYCVPVHIFLNLGNNKIDKKEVYVFYGCNLLGQRRYIASILADDFPSTSDWYDFFQSFKNRGLEQLLYAVLIDNKAMKDALKLSFLDVFPILSIFDAISKISKYFSSSYGSNVLTYIKNIYLGSDLSEYDIYLDNFKEAYPSSFALDLIESNLIKAKDIYSLPLHLRKALYSFYFLRDNIKRLIVISHSKQYFNSLNEFISDCIPVFQVLELKTYCSKKAWVEVLNTLYETKKELIKPYL